MRRVPCLCSSQHICLRLDGACAQQHVPVRLACHTVAVRPQIFHPRILHMLQYSSELPCCTCLLALLLGPASLPPQRKQTAMSCAANAVTHTACVNTARQ